MWWCEDEVPIEKPFYHTLLDDTLRHPGTHRSALRRQARRAIDNRSFASRRHGHWVDARWSDDVVFPHQEDEDSD